MYSQLLKAVPEFVTVSSRVTPDRWEAPAGLQGWSATHAAVKSVVTAAVAASLIDLRENSGQVS